MLQNHINTMLPNFPRLLRELRQEKGLSQVNLAKKTGMSRHHIQTLEKEDGAGSCSWEDYNEIVRRLNPSLTESRRVAQRRVMPQVTATVRGLLDQLK